MGNKKKSLIKGTRFEKRLEASPFRQELVIPEGYKLVKLMAGKESQLSLVAGSTGEELDLLSFTRKKVDKETFVKYYTNTIAIQHNLKLSGRRAMDVVQWVVQETGIDKDEIHLGEQEVKLWNKRPGIERKMSTSSLYRGIEELLVSGILARSRPEGQTGYYWINPKILFNGKRQCIIDLIELDETFLEGELCDDPVMLTDDKQKDFGFE